MRKTTATVALAISATLVLSACGSADEPEAVSVEPSLSEEAAPETEEPEVASETTIEVEEPVSNPTPVDEEPPEAPIPVENIPNESFYREAAFVSDDDRANFETIAVKVGDKVRIETESWLATPGECVSEEETGENELALPYSPWDSLTYEIDPRVLVRTFVPEKDSPEYKTNPVIANLPEGETIVLHETGEFTNFEFSAFASGSSLLTFSYSCEPTGEAFDTTWIIDVE